MSNVTYPVKNAKQEAHYYTIVASSNSFWNWYVQSKPYVFLNNYNLVDSQEDKGFQQFDWRVKACLLDIHINPLRPRPGTEVQTVFEVGGFEAEF
jgi:hypothetical protein